MGSIVEQWDILDHNRTKTGKTVRRGAPMLPDEFHLVVHVWVRNSKGQFIISKRTPNKTFPNMWEVPGGSAVSGDTSLQTALKETKEEIGLALDPRKGQLIYQFKRDHKKYPDFLDVWLFESEVNIDNLVYQPDEVSDARWASKKEILSMMKSKTFVDVFDYLQKLFEEY